MGNREHGAVFRQSLRDFPCPVVLGRDTPSFGLHRYKQGLQFFPVDDECFTVRGDRQRLLYKGRQRSHRFTILGDTAFEYDCILEREPESNVITLLIPNAEHFDFFRQPDFIKDPLLAGSYAVYKKETLVGEGTGKLCHIHRPEIIDNRGRRCWGDLAVVGNELRITIPEQWLSEAKYPVIVDPIVGTSTVGSNKMWVYDEGDEPQVLVFDNQIPINRFTVPETINGDCEAFVYVNQDDSDAGGRPVFYSDNNNKPHSRKSTGEGFIDMRVTGNKLKGWRSTSFKPNESITSGTNIWFGVFCEYMWYPLFDYGAQCYLDFYDGNEIPNTYPIHSYSVAYDLKLPMFFYYTSALNYVRTITQGVSLRDSKKTAADFQRTALQGIRAVSVFMPTVTMLRRCLDMVYNRMGFDRVQKLYRTAVERAGIGERFASSSALLRNCVEAVRASGGIQHIRGLRRGIKEILTGWDNCSFQAVYVRSVRERQGAYDFLSHWRGFLRAVRDVSGSMTETERNGGFYRLHGDRVQAQGNALRELFMRVRLVSSLAVREFILGRFLVSRKDIVLKSCITCEINLESRI